MIKHKTVLNRVQSYTKSIDITNNLHPYKVP